MNSLPFRQLKPFFKILIGVQYKILVHLRHGLSNVSIHCDFSAQNKTASLHPKVIEWDAV